MAGEPGTITIRFEGDTEPLAGAIVAGGEEIAFSGWIQLASLIDQLRPRVRDEEISLREQHAAGSPATHE